MTWVYGDELLLYAIEMKESAKEKATGAKEYIQETGSSIAGKGQGKCDDSH